MEKVRVSGTEVVGVREWGVRTIDLPKIPTGKFDGHLF